MTAAIWCKEHVPTKTIVHRMYDIVDETGLNALQLYVQNFKQADLTLTGTVRKATLVNQSTKIANQTVNVTAPNRRTSTITVLSNGGRRSISNIKVEESLGSGTGELLASPISAADNYPTCITCGIDVSPKWWPYPAAQKPLGSISRSVAPGLLPSESPSTSSDGEGSLQQPGQLLTNGHSAPDHVQDNPKHHVALAAAALQEKTEEAGLSTGDKQCHKCHHRGVHKALRSPPRTVPLHQEVPFPQPSTSACAVTTPVISSQQTSPQYAWATQRAYSPPGPPNDWSRPSPTTTQAVPTHHQFNGNQSPGGVGSTAHHLNTQSQIRSSAVPPIPHSPHINGALGHSHNNGYPPSPHHSISSTHPITNGTFVSYASTRPPPQHLTNGGPPPRAPENPFSQQSHASVHHHQSFGGSYSSPTVPRESLPINLEHTNPAHGARPGNGRVNGGASASPSLRNLLS